MGELTDRLMSQDHLPVCKFKHHLEVYDEIFLPYKNQKINFLEIGIDRGGSLQIWSEYFTHPKTKIYGVDISPECEKLEKLIPKTKIFIGNAGHASFLKKVCDEAGDVDIIIDDGNHMMIDQITAFDFLFTRLKNPGIYICEDTHTSYRSSYGGGYMNSDSFVTHIKNVIDFLHYPEFRDSESKSDHKKYVDLFEIRQYPGLTVIFKSPKAVQCGSAILTGSLK